MRGTNCYVRISRRSAARCSSPGSHTGRPTIGYVPSQKLAAWIIFGATSMELSGRLLGLEVDYDAVIRPFSNLDVDRIVHSGRHRAVRNAIPKKSFRQFLKGLQENRAILITVDQATTASNKVMAPFFSIPAATSVNAARIAQKTGAAILPVLWLREADLSGYRVEIGEQLTEFPTNDEMADAIRINSLIEQQIRRAPEQYYWVHRRFKNEPSPYDD